MLTILAPLLLPVLAASLIINEVLYDPPGSDAGGEFVELLCAAADGCELERLELEFINGDDPSPADIVWRSGGPRRIALGERWVVGGDRVDRVDAFAELGLQNGPDALRLLRDGATLDAVAWGDAPGLGEGNPAVDVGGTALARVPDGIDTDDNARDFAPREPTPGVANSHPEELRLHDVVMDPPWLPRPGESRLELEAEFVGDAPGQRGEILVLDDVGVLATRSFDGARLELLHWSVPLRLSFGDTDLRVVTQSATVADTVVLGVRIGRDRLWLNEAMPAPTQGEPEWIELKGSAPEGSWSIRDAAAAPRRFELMATAPLQLLSEDCARLRALRSFAVELPCVELDGGWISLNNSVPSGGSFADRIQLMDEHGRVVDAFEYGAELRAGRSFERVVVGDVDGGQWFVSPGEPTPGRENLSSAGLLPARGLELSPEPFTPDGDGVDDVLHVVLAASSTRSAEAAVHELAGARVRHLGSASNAGGYLRWLWDGRDDRGQALPWGAYVVIVVADGAAGRWKALCALGRR